MTEPVLAALQQWLLFSGTIIVVGCVAWRVLVAPRAARALAGDSAGFLVTIERRVASMGLVAIGIVAVAWGMRLLVQFLGFHFPGDPIGPDISFLVRETVWGTVWMVQGAILPFALVAFWLARRGAAGPGVSAPWYAATLLALGLSATLAMSGHAMGVDSWRPLIVGADALHTVAAGTWIGSLAVILTAGLPAPGASSLASFTAQLRSFSPLAVASVSALLGMGVVLAWTHLVALSDLWTMTYGRVLAAKIAVAGIVLLVGLWNWQRGLRGLDTEAGARAVRQHALWEVSFALVVLLLTAILVHSPKPS